MHDAAVKTDTREINEPPQRSSPLSVVDIKPALNGKSCRPALFPFETKVLMFFDATAAIINAVRKINLFILISELLISSAARKLNLISMAHEFIV